MSLSSYTALLKNNCRYPTAALTVGRLLALSGPWAQCWVKGAMELEGNSWSMLPKIVKCLQAANGEAAVQT